jgi:integrase/recombinase XerD
LASLGVLWLQTARKWSHRRGREPSGISSFVGLRGASIRQIFKAAFEQAGVRYFHPHSFRKTLVQLAFDLKLTAEQLKAWSQNLRHDDVMTTFASYGTVERNRQAEIMREVRHPPKPTAPAADLLGQMAELIEKAMAGRA